MKVFFSYVGVWTIVLTMYEYTWCWLELGKIPTFFLFLYRLFSVVFSRAKQESRCEINKNDTNFFALVASMVKAKRFEFMIC